MAVIFARALGANTQGYGEKLTFSDAGKIADYAKDAVGFAVANGLLTGTGGGKFDPTSIADRQSVALVASRFIQTVKPQTPAPAPTVPQPNTTQPTTPAPAVPVPAPVVNVPSTPQVPSGNTGGSIETPVRDVQAPVLTLVSIAPFKIGTDLTVRSSEAGTVYLVPSASNVSNKSVLDGLVTEGKGVKATAATAGGDVLLTTSTLTEGIYNAYAVDASGNVSIPVTEIVLKPVFEGPEFKMITNSTFSLTFPEELNNVSRPQREDFIIKRIDGGMNDEIEVFQASISEKGIDLYFIHPLVKGATYQVAYAPKANNQPIKGISGTVYGSFTSSFTYTNIPPKAAQYLQDLTLAANRTSSTVDVLSAFRDWDSDDQELLYTVISDNTDVVEASLEGSKLYLNTKSALSTATITITAKDSSGDKVSQTFKVTVVDAATAINAAEAAIASDKDLTGQSSDLTDAKKAVSDAKDVLAALSDDATKTAFANRLKVVEDTLNAVSAAETLVKALEDATGDNMNLLMGEEDRDAADLADSNIVYGELVKGKSLSSLENRVEKARLFITNADELEGSLQTAQNNAGYFDDISKGSPKRATIDSILAGLSFEGVTGATKLALESKLEWIQSLLADADKADAQVTAFEQAVTAAEGKPADAPEWQAAYAAKAAINYDELNSGTAKALRERETAATNKFPTPTP
ncbi:S-layer homology domain-containing protein [Saccharibacillus sp. O23]|uniref:S-layer homology domain-containing protein n=1 Tax=Saccharibacillus sp. O23 TaxID=2009338 RepID=UPI00211AC678|nr:S-layer homology domain-containing protein [Saccharibacillus sp. O23]